MELKSSMAENYVRTYNGTDGIYYYRDKDKKEIDLLIESVNTIHPVSQRFNMNKELSSIRLKSAVTGMIIALLLLSLSACGTGRPDADARDKAEEPAETVQQNNEEADEEGDTEKEIIDMKMTINDTEVTVEWEDNESVKALKEKVAEGALTLHLSAYGGFEQVGAIGETLPSADIQTVTKPGDIVLYSGNQMVIFYGSNSWSYTRLGKITDKTETELQELLGGNEVTVVLK